jgi:aspartyl protease family protein
MRILCTTTSKKFRRGISASLVVGICCMLSPGIYAEECAVEAYASPDGHADVYPLSKPHAELLRTLNAAKKGNATEQRNLAVSYESGYLVTQCAEKAGYWYRRAAKSGDKVATAWVAEHDMLDMLSAGPECVGSGCNLASAGMPQTMSLIADSRGHFHSSLTINGVEVQGVIDTGATLVSISTATASAMGIPLEGGHAGRSQTANGAINMLSKVMPSVRIGNIVLENVEISISANTPTLIGMSVLSRLKIREENGQMVLSK